MGCSSFKAAMCVRHWSMVGSVVVDWPRIGLQNALGRVGELDWGLQQSVGMQLLVVEQHTEGKLFPAVGHYSFGMWLDWSVSVGGCCWWSLAFCCWSASGLWCWCVLGLVKQEGISLFMKQMCCPVWWYVLSFASMKSCMVLMQVLLWYLLCRSLAWYGWEIKLLGLGRVLTEGRWVSCLWSWWSFCLTFLWLGSCTFPHNLWGERVVLGILWEGYVIFHGEWENVVLSVLIWCLEDGWWMCLLPWMWIGLSWWSWPVILWSHLIEDRGVIR